MLIAALTIGDISITLNGTYSLSPDENRANGDNPHSFTLSFHDLPTGEKQDLVYFGENDALLALSAWIAADETWAAANPQYAGLIAKLSPKFKP